MKTYREHYDIAKTYYKGELKDSGDKDLYSLKLDADIFDANDQYYNIVSKISEKVHKKINNKDGVLEKNLATYLNEWRDISEMSDLLDHIMPDIESKVFKTNAQVEFLHPYRNKPSSNAESSWLWHYDDSPDEFLKMVIYLNEVNETNGAFQYLENEEGDCPIIHSNRTYPGHTGVPQKFAKSRIPQEEIDKKNYGSELEKHFFRYAKKHGLELKAQYPIKNDDQNLRLDYMVMDQGEVVPLCVEIMSREYHVRSLSQDYKRSREVMAKNGVIFVFLDADYIFRKPAAAVKQVLRIYKTMKRKFFKS